MAAGFACTVSALSRIAILGVLPCSQSALAQAPHPADPVREGTDNFRIGELVKQGVLARSQLDKARTAQADEEDEAVLRRILYGNLSIEDLTEEQGEEMVAAARRRFERQQVRLEEAKKLVEAGAASRLSLTPYLEDLDRRRRTLNLALSRARLIRDLAEMARIEVAVLTQPPVTVPEAGPVAERFDGNGVFTAGWLSIITQAFERQFSKPLPISANGATALHRALGYDHRGRVDVALDPDRLEGVWLRKFLQNLGIPYFAFRRALPGKSTGPHIHIGPPSEPIRSKGSWPIRAGGS